MKNQSAEDYLDKLLNSVNGEETEEIEENIPEEVSFEPAEKPVAEVYSRRVSKSEADFLTEFEAELEGEKFDDFLKKFNEDIASIEDIDVSFDGEEFVFGEAKTEPAPVEETSQEENPFDIFEMEDSAENEIPVMDEIPVVDELPVMDEIPVGTSDKTDDVMDSFDLGGVDLAALLNEANSEEIPATEVQLDEFQSSEPQSDEAPVEDLFANLFGEETMGQASEMEDLFSGGESSTGGIDLGNLGEADLMSLLSGEDGLSDLGDMLSQSDSSEMPMDGLDAFAAFAESEMSDQNGESDRANVKAKKTKKTKKEGKGGLIDKIKEFILSDDDEDEEDEVELKKSASPSANQLSEENADILAAMDAEDKGGKGKGGLFGKTKKKDKEPKEKKQKPPKEKKQKKVKEKKVKEKKPKKPKEVDNTPPLPRGPVIMIWVMVLSLLALVYLGTNLTGYSSYVSKAKSYYNTGNYAEAYQELLGLTIKEKDMTLYNQVATLATVDSELNAYKVFLERDRHTEALDSLICAAGRCELNEDSADVYECLGQMEILKKEISNELRNYGMTYEQALEMYHIKDREDYTIALYTKLKELGLE